MSTAPNHQPANNPKRNSSYGDHPPTPIQMLRVFRACIRGFHWHREKPKVTDVALVILTLLVALAAFWSAWIFQGQLKAFNRQIADTEAVEKASLVFDSFKIEIPIGPAQPLQFRCGIKNVGQTTAILTWVSFGGGGGDPGDRFHVINNLRHFDVKIPMPSKPEPSEPGASIEPHGETIAGGQSRDCSRALAPLSQDQLAGKVFLYHEISIGYRDLFGNSGILNDCLIYQPVAGRFAGCDTETQGNPN